MASAPHSPSALSPRQSMRKELVLALVLNSVVVGPGSPPPGSPIHNTMKRQSQDFRRNPGHRVPHSDQCWKLHAGPWQLIPKAPSTHSNPLTPQESEAAALTKATPCPKFRPLHPATSLQALGRAGPGFPKHPAAGSPHHTLLSSAPKSGAPHARSLPAKNNNKSKSLYNTSACQAPWGAARVSTNPSVHRHPQLSGMPARAGTGRVGEGGGAGGGGGGQGARRQEPGHRPHLLRRTIGESHTQMPCSSLHPSGLRGAGLSCSGEGEVGDPSRSSCTYRGTQSQRGSRTQYSLPTCLGSSHIQTHTKLFCKQPSPQALPKGPKFGAHWDPLQLYPLPSTRPTKMTETWGSVEPPIVPLPAK